MAVLHGLIQLAAQQANDLRSMIREAEDGWQLWIWDDGAWLYLGRFTRKNDVQLLLQALLPQPD
jgi:hypothetical protein